MRNCKLPTDSLAFAGVRHFANRFHTPLPSSWIHSPIKALSRLSCFMIGRIFSQVVLLALPHILYTRGGDVLISSKIPASHFVLSTNKLVSLLHKYLTAVSFALYKEFVWFLNIDQKFRRFMGKWIFSSEFFLHWVPHELTFLWTTRGVKRNSIDYCFLLNKEGAVTILLSRPQTLPF